MMSVSEKNGRLLRDQEIMGYKWIYNLKYPPNDTLDNMSKTGYKMIHPHI